MKKTAETYKQARERLLRELSEAGWTTKPALKKPQAIPPEKDFVLYFHAQSVYLDKHSMWVDIRGMTVQHFMYECVAHGPGDRNQKAYKP